MERHPYVDGAVIDCPVALLLSEAGERRNAMTVSQFSEVAHFPASMWVSVAIDTFTYELIEQSGRFSVSLLHAAQKELAWRFGTRSGREQDKWAEMRTHRSEAGFWHLDGALASAGCKVRQRRALGATHVLYVADLEDGETTSETRRQRHLLVSDLR